MKTLSIIVTHYNEPEEVCRPLFDSIAVQEGLNFDDLEVIVVNDGTENVLPKEFFDKYTYRIRTYEKEHAGISAARNYGLDRAKHEFVAFCDCDDMFNMVLSLYQYQMFMEEADYDVICGAFLEEQFVDGKLTTLRHDADITFIHGKFYKKKFLLDNNIRFYEDVMVHEDGCFNGLVRNLTQNWKLTQFPLYIWKYNPNSIVRKDSTDFVLKTYDQLMQGRINICNELLNREYITEYRQCVAKTVMDSYYDFQKPNALKPENKEIVLKAKRAFKKFYETFKQDYLEQNVNDIAEIMYICRTLAYKNGLRVEQQTVSEFLTEIVNLKG